MNTPAYYRDLIDRILNETTEDDDIPSAPPKDELKRQHAIRYLKKMANNNIRYVQFIYFPGPSDKVTTAWQAPFSYLIRGKIPVVSLEFIDGYFNNHLIARIDYNLNVDEITDEEMVDLERVVSAHLKYLGFAHPQVEFMNLASNIIQLSAPGVVNDILKVGAYKKLKKRL